MLLAVGLSTEQIHSCIYIYIYNNSLCRHYLYIWDDNGFWWCVFFLVQTCISRDTDKLRGSSVMSTSMSFAKLRPFSLDMMHKVALETARRTFVRFTHCDTENTVPARGALPQSFRSTKRSTDQWPYICHLHLLQMSRLCICHHISSTAANTRSSTGGP